MVQQLNIYTDHKNLTYKNCNTGRVLRWILIIEEYGLDIKYIPSKNNLAADALPQLPNNGNQETTHESMYLRHVPAQDFPFYLIIWYITKTIPNLLEYDQFVM